MLKIELIDGRSAPRIYCDFCGRPITNYKLGIALFSGNLMEGIAESCFHVHKGECDKAFKEQHGHLPWHELRKHLQYICHNVGLPIEELQEDEFDRLAGD